MKYLSLILAFLFLIACNDDDCCTPIVEDPTAEEADLRTLSNGILQFGFDLLKSDLDEESKTNKLISPLSIHTALSMTSNGAVNSTKDDMLSTLYAGDLGVPTLNAAYEKMNMDHFSESDALHVFNAVFHDDSRAVSNKDVLANLARYYNAELQDLDFGLDQSIATINDWAKESTNDRIPKILEEIDDCEIMFLINALYFAGDWKLGFEEQNTQAFDFQNQDGSIVSTDFMIADEQRSFMVNEDYSLLDMTIKGEEFAMSFILPKGDLTATLNGANWLSEYNQLLDGLAEDRVFVYLPKFEIKSHYLLNDVLKALGMESAFEGGMDGLAEPGLCGGNTFISRVIHDAFIKVDEKGVEGAAVTTVGVGQNSVPPIIKFDKPFLYVLRHIETGIPVFMGTVDEF